MKDETDTICREGEKARGKPLPQPRIPIVYLKLTLRKQHRFPETTVATMLGQAGHFTAVCSMHTGVEMA